MTIESFFIAHDEPITQDLVNEIADRLVQAGETPSGAKVRAVIGRGSYATIAPLLKSWKDAQRVVDARPITTQQTPESIIELHRRSVDEVWSAALSVADERLATERKAFEDARLAYEEELKDAREMGEEAEKALEALDAEKASLLAEKEALEAEKTALIEQVSKQAQRQHDLERDLGLVRSQAADLQARFEKSDQEKEGLRSDVKGLHARLEERASESAALTAKLEASEQAKEQLQTELADARKAAMQAERESQKVLFEAQSKAQGLQAKIDAVEHINLTLKADLDVAKIEVSDAVKRAAMLEGRLVELEKVLKKVDDKPTAV